VDEQAARHENTVPLIEEGRQAVLGEQALPLGQAQVRDLQAVVVLEGVGEVVPLQRPVQEPDLGRVLATDVLTAYTLDAVVLAVAVHQTDLAVAGAAVQLEVVGCFAEVRHEAGHLAHLFVLVQIVLVLAG